MKSLKRTLWILTTLVLLSWSIIVSAEPGLLGYYYDDFEVDDGIISFSEEDLVMTRVDATIDFYNGNRFYRWNAVAGGENYGVRWVGLLRIDEAGEYGFGTLSDDGSTVRIDGQIVVSNAEYQYFDWEDSIAEGSFEGLYPEQYGDPDNLPGPLYLAEGFHTIEVCFFEDIVYDGVELWWLKPGLGPSDIPYYGVSWDGDEIEPNPDTNWEIIPSDVLSTPASAVPGTSEAILLHPAVPNPFNPQTTIAFDLPQTQALSLRILDVSGRTVKTLLANEVLAAGRHEMLWNGRDARGRHCPSGIYFSCLEGGGVLATERMTLLK